MLSLRKKLNEFKVFAHFGKQNFVTNELLKSPSPNGGRVGKQRGDRVPQK